MSLRRIDCASHDELLASSDACIAQALSQAHTVDLIVPDGGWVQQRKLLLREGASCGVDVRTYGNWLAGLWEIYGDGRMLVDASQRSCLLRHILQREGDIFSSSMMITEMGGFFEEAIALPDACAMLLDEELSDAVRRILMYLDLYRDMLAERNLVEPALAETLLADMSLPHRVIVIERPDELPAHSGRILERLASQFEIYLVEQVVQPGSAPVEDPARPAELFELHHLLFTGKKGLEATGAVIAAESCGYHARGGTLVALIERLLDDGADSDDIALVTADPGDLHPVVLEALAAADLGFEARFRLPLRRTCFGAAFLEALETLEEHEFDESYLSLADLVGTPYSGLSRDDSLALRNRWRGRGGSTPKERLDDLVTPFSSRCKSTQWRERTSFLRAIIDAASAVLESAGDVDTWAKAVDTLTLQLFQNARASMDDGAVRREDDIAAMQAIGDFVNMHIGLGVTADVRALESVCVPLARAYEGKRCHIEIVSCGQVGLRPWGHIILGDLSARCYPMASRPGVFADLLGRIGVDIVDDLASRQRRLLLDCIDSCRKGFAFYRVCNDSTGKEERQSALWDEMLTPYDGRSEEDEPIDTVPATLVDAGCHVVVSEDELCIGREDEEKPKRSFRRGHLIQPASVDLLVPGLEYLGNESFSPTGLELLYRCPYSWFISRRINAKQLDRAFDLSAQGTLAHDALSRFYETFQEGDIRRITEDNLSEALELADRVFEETLARPRDGRERIRPRTRRDELKVEETRGQVRELLMRDEVFLPGFTPRYFELKLGNTSGGLSRIEYAGVPVRGTVDRIDVDEQGNAVIIDYKLSKLDSGYGLRGESDLPQRIQTDIYATMVQRHFEALGEPLKVVGSVYRSYAGNNLRGVYSAALEWGERERVAPAWDAVPREESKGKVGVGNYDAYLSRIEQEVSKTLDAMKAGHFEPRPLPRCADVCKYCLAANICSERRS